MPLTAELAAQVEERVLAKASEQTGAQMRNLTDRVVMRVDPDGAKERAAERKQQRCMGIDSKEDDMARLWAYLPTNLATACYDRVDKIAKQAQLPQDPRTLDQIRADVVGDLLLATPDKTSAVKVEVYVTVTAATLMGLSEQPGEIAGYGAIIAGLARELAADATWRRLLTDPFSGEALEFGTSTYRPGCAAALHLGTRSHVQVPRLHASGAQVEAGPHGAVPRGRDRRGQPRLVLQTAPPGQAPLGVGSRPASPRHVHLPQPRWEDVRTSPGTSARRPTALPSTRPELLSVTRRA